MRHNSKFMLFVGGGANRVESISPFLKNLDQCGPTQPTQMVTDFVQIGWLSGMYGDSVRPYH